MAISILQSRFIRSVRLSRLQWSCANRCRYTTGTLSPTEPLYQRDESLRALDITVVAVSKVSQLVEADRFLFKQATEQDTVVTTTKTIFYAQGGGQPYDIGRMVSKDGRFKFRVSSVRNGTNGQILHLGQFEPASLLFAGGDTVHQEIDGKRRIMNSRVHTAGHVISLAVRRLDGVISGVSELKAQHYPGFAFVEFKGIVDSKHKDTIEEKANEFIEQAMPVKVYWWNEQELREKCVAVPEAVAISEGKLIRVVDIEGAGAYPCGGTHVSNTKKVGKVVIRKISRSKGNSKISYSIFP